MTDEQQAQTQIEEQKSTGSLEKPKAGKPFSESEIAQRGLKAKTLLQQAPVTAAIFAANMIVFITLVVMTNLRSLLIPSQQTLIDWSANYGPLTLGGEPWRIVSNTFLHASIFHLAVNLYVLFNLGPYVENLLGSRRMFALYMLSGVAGSLSSLVWNPYQISAGASGALMGLFGCFVEHSVLGSGFTIKEILRPARVMLLGAVILSCVYGAFIPGVDNAAHLGGFLAGTMLSHFFRQDLKTIWGKRDSAVVGVSLTALILGTSAEYFSVRSNAQFLAMLDCQNAVPLIDQKKYKEALVYMNSAVNRYKNVEILLKRRDVLVELRRFDDALKDCETAVALSPDTADVYWARAYIYHLLRHRDLALADISKALSINQKFPPAYNLRAWTNASFRKMDTTIEDCNKALTLNSSFYPAWDTRGICNYILGNNQKAIEDLTKSAQLADDPGGALFHRAMVYERLGKKAEAEADRLEAKRLNYEPEDWEMSLNAEGAQH
ncbi:MAG: hypothetical protein DKT66_07140 [Candidatus Melainabacteria bacterium]|nr:MAG: hypothetical protein DKT66_07140 [Candidatus Melainabacteria bacterium]